MSDSLEFIQVGPWSPFVAPLPVPTVDPDEDTLVRVCIPRSYWAYIMGALSNYTQRETWRGNADAITLACKRFSLLLSMLSDDEACQSLEAPGFDDADTSDGQSDRATPWYYYENWKDWVLLGLLAIAFTPGAAIVIMSIATRLRFLFRKRAWGAIVRIIVDELLVAEIDTYSATDTLEAVYIDVPSGGGGGGGDGPDLHTIRVEHSGEHNENATPGPDGYALEWCRGYLVAEDVVSVTGVRQNVSQPCTLEYTEDGEEWVPFADLQKCSPRLKMVNGVAYLSSDGETWVKSSEEFNTYDASYMLYNAERRDPAWGGETAACMAAANAVHVFVQLHFAVVDWYEAEGTALALTAAVAAFLAILFPVSWPMWGAAFGFESLALWVLQYTAALTDASFTPTIQDELRCIFQDNFEADGTVTEAGFNAIVSAVDANSGDMWDLLVQYLSNVAGPVGLHNAAQTTFLVSANCEACSATGCLDMRDGELHDFHKGEGDGGIGVNVYCDELIGMYIYDDNQSGGPWAGGARRDWDGMVPEGATQILVDFVGEFQVDLGWSNADGTTQTIYVTDAQPDTWYDLPETPSTQLGWKSETQMSTYNYIARFCFR